MLNNSFFRIVFPHTVKALIVCAVKKGLRHTDLAKGNEAGKLTKDQSITLDFIIP